MYKDLPKIYGIRKWVGYNNYIIEIFDSDPYHYGLVKNQNGKIIKETELFNPRDDEKIIQELKEWIDN